MKMNHVGCGILAAIVMAAGSIGIAAGDGAATKPAADPSVKEIAVTFTGGYETEGVDKGRPVILIAAALNVPAEVFRKAFSGVKPAGPGEKPEESQVRKNKQVLMEALSPYGVTDDRLNEVSNFYRYQRSKGDMWKNTPAEATATLKNGVVTAITITKPGAGYSSPPKVTVAGVANVDVKVTVAYTTDLKTNGSIKEITLGTGK